MARPRSVSNDEVFAAAHRAMSRLGPGELRLVDIADEAGVTPSALVQRFGSKRALLLALARAWSGSAPGFFGELRERHPEPLTALRRYAECVAQLARSPAAFSRSLAYLHIDLTDDDFRETLQRHASETRRELEALLREAASSGDLAEDVDPVALARTVETVLAGSMITWAHHREGTASDWMLDDLDAVLRPHLPERRSE